MKILSNYVLRAHLGPFLFAFTAVTGLLFLNAVAQRMEDLAGRGLEWNVIVEFMVFSFPHIVALTFPMAILVAVLYAFSDMTAENEIAAIASGGIHPLRLMVPLVGVGIILSLLMFNFNDRVLPEANHRLSTLLSDVGSTNPTFELREEVINEIHTGDNTRYFLRARSIDPSTNHLQDVTIFDLSRVGEVRTIVAEEGQMSFTPDRLDLYLILDNGVVYEQTEERPGDFQRLEYKTQILPLRGVGQELERRAGGRRSDREMTISMLELRAREDLNQLARIADESRRLSLNFVNRTLGGDADAEAMAQAEAVADPDRIDWDLEAVADAALIDPGGAGLLSDEAVGEVANVHRTNDTLWNIYRLSSYRYRVEIHKKYAIAFACLIFVLLGPPLAIRFPQGGVGMVIAASVGIFFFYWVGLIAGERLADRGQVNPIVGMWAPNVLLLIPTVFFLATAGRQISTNRGGGLWGRIRARFARTLHGIRQGRRLRLEEEVP